MRPGPTLLAVLVVAAAVVTAATVWPAPAPAGPAPAARAARSLPVSSTTIVCPTVPERGIAGGAGGSSASARSTLGIVVGPRAPGEPAGARARLTVTTVGGRRLPLPAAPTAPVVTAVPAHSRSLVVTARGPDVSGASAMVDSRVDGEGARGSATARCETPRAHWWFLAPGTQVGRRPALVLVNPAPGPVQVDLALSGPAGPVRASAATGIVLAGHDQTVVPLDALAPDLEALAVHVIAQGGRVVAALWDTQASGLDPRGLDWVPAAAPPAREQVIPVVPAGDGERTLYVAAPGDQEAVVAVRVLGESGPYAPSGRESLVVPAGSVAALDVGGLAPAAAQPAPVGLALRSDVPVTAATLARVGGSGGGEGDGPGEFAWSPAGAPLRGPAVLALARAGQVTRTELVLAAPTRPASARVDVDYPGSRAAARTVHLPAGTVATVALAPPEDVTSYQVFVRPVGGGPLLAAATIRAGRGQDEWITLAPVTGGPPTIRLPPVVRDLRVGAP